MNNTTQKFIACLEEAELLLSDHPVFNYPNADRRLSYLPPEQFNLSHFKKWSEVCETEFAQNPPVRIIQHLSCTGGSLISKCLAAMPNAALLSEVHPHCQLLVKPEHKFAPTDLTYLAIKAGFQCVDELSEKIFKADIKVILEHLNLLGKYLVIREHSHTDFLIGESPIGFSTIKKMLRNDHKILSVVTVRHPVDSYLSLLKADWIHFAPNTFDEYCRRYLLFIKHNKDTPVFKYEDFVADPQKEMRLMSKALSLPFNEDFQDLFDLNSMSGESGRSSNDISTRQRHQINDEQSKQINESSHYRKLCERLSYEPALE